MKLTFVPMLNAARILLSQCIVFILVFQNKSNLIHSLVQSKCWRVGTYSLNSHSYRNCCHGNQGYNDEPHHRAEMIGTTLIINGVIITSLIMGGYYLINN